MTLTLKQDENNTQTFTAQCIYGGESIDRDASASRVTRADDLSDLRTGRTPPGPKGLGHFSYLRLSVIQKGVNPVGRLPASFIWAPLLLQYQDTELVPQETVFATVYSLILGL